MTISVSKFLSKLTSSFTKILQCFKQKKPVKEVYYIEKFTISFNEIHALHLSFLRFQGDQIGRDKNNSYTVTIPMGYSVDSSDIIELVIEQEGEDYNLVTDIVIDGDLYIKVNQFISGITSQHSTYS